MSEQFLRGSDAYAEVLRIVEREAIAHWIADESVRQINGRWLKGDFITLNDQGRVQLRVDGSIATKSRRIRIPRDSWMRGRRL